MTTGAALAAAFPAPDVGPLALLALVPLLLVVEPLRPRLAGALGYVAGLTFFGLHLLWIAEFLSWTGWVAWLAWGALSATQAVFVAVFFALVPATRRLGPLRLLVLPACWATLELLRAHQPLGGFPWGLLALTQHDAGLLLPLARVVGGYGLAAVIVAVNLAAAFWLRAMVEAPSPAAAPTAATAGAAPTPAAAPTAAAAASVDGAAGERRAGRHSGSWRVGPGRQAGLTALPSSLAAALRGGEDPCRRSWWAPRTASTRSAANRRRSGCPATRWSRSPPRTG